MSIRCMIVDDEPLSQRVIQRYLNDVPFLELVATCSHALEAMEVLKKESIQLIFLDINMPRLSGINFVKTLSNPPLIIFTTAYPEYAVEGFELEAVDYLLKPFSFERLLKATYKAQKLIETENTSKNISAPNHFVFKSDKKLYKLDFEEVLYFQAYGDYVKIFTSKKLYVTKERLTNIEKELPKNMFFKIHRSYIIALNAVEYVEGNQVKIAEELLPISQTFREELVSRIKG
ncbi:MAG: LytR/AlgR family response regulator transcription factor [Saprospiraceae bacterium]